MSTANTVGQIYTGVIALAMIALLTYQPQAQGVTETVVAQGVVGEEAIELDNDCPHGRDADGVLHVCVDRHVSEDDRIAQIIRDYRPGPGDALELRRGSQMSYAEARAAAIRKLQARDCGILELGCMMDKHIWGEP